MGLVLRRHPSANTFVQQNVLRVERFKLRVFRRSQLLRDKVIRPQVQRNANDANRRHPQSRYGHKQHEEVQPPLVAERYSEDLRPEAVRCHHRVRFFRLGRVERPEGVGAIAVFKQGVLHCGSMNRTEQRSAENTGDAHHVERVEREVVEALHKQDEPEDRRYSKARRKEPGGLAQGVHQEDAGKDRNRTGEGDRVVRTDADQAGNLELPQAEADQAEGTVQGDKGPQTAELTPAGEVALRFWSPQQEQGVP